uniref:Uncharacterized protein n=1 Tax=Arundo donax TaxID=35708 RepID=A0A0A9E8K4_ARUDO
MIHSHQQGDWGKGNWLSTEIHSQ